MYEVAVVGAGPAGSLSAYVLSSEGFKVAVFEEHQSPGFPCQCAGLISEDCLKLLSNYVDVEVCGKIKGAYVFSPSGNFAKVRGRSKAVVVDRKILDYELFRLASSTAKTFVKCRVNSVSNGYSLFTSAGRFEAEYVVGADGPQSIVAKNLGFERPKILSAVQLECDFECFDENYVEIYLGYSDFLFGYAVPVDDGFARVGIVSETNAILWLERLMKFLSDRVNAKKCCELNCGAVPFGLVDFVKDKAILIGDSAGMVKPYTGGGIYYLSIAAEKLRYFPDLERVRREYLKEMQREYRLGMKIARLYRELSDDDFDYLVDVAKSVNLSDVHMDRPTTLLKALPAVLKILNRPSLLARVGRLLLP